MTSTPSPAPSCDIATMELSTSAPSRTSSRRMSTLMELRTSSPAPDCGRSRDEWRGGTDLFGARPAPASPSRSRARVEAPTTQGICGPTSFASSVPVGPLSSWESRLREALATIGSTESHLTWKVKVMRSGRSKSRLVPSMRLTGEAETGGSQWPTPTIADVEGGRKTRSGSRSNEMLLNGLMTQWPTPAARDWRSDRSKLTSEELYGSKGRPLARQILEASGTEPNGSDAPTARFGVPNPVFACWLMGWPDELISGALQAIASFRKSRRKSSAPISTPAPEGTIP